MRAVVFEGPGQVGVQDVVDAAIEEASDVLVRISHTAICGSDLWFYRGRTEWPAGRRLGHEFVGSVEEVGRDISQLSPGDVVVSPFVFSCGACEFCLRGIQTSCVRGGFFGGLNGGAQAEAVRVPLAETTLLRLDPSLLGSESMARSILLVSDVLGTGYHAAVSAKVAPGGTAVVIGDGAVGLCAAVACRLLGAERVIVVGRHRERLDLASALGATDVLQDSVDVGAALQDMTGGGAPSVLECVGTESAMGLATDVSRPGGVVGYVGVPHGSERLDLNRLFRHNITLRGGVAPVRAYMPRLLEAVVSGAIDPSPILDLEMSLEEATSGYEAMDARSALKVLLRP